MPQKSPDCGEKISMRTKFTLSTRSHVKGKNRISRLNTELDRTFPMTNAVCAYSDDSAHPFRWKVPVLSEVRRDLRRGQIQERRLENSSQESRSSLQETVHNSAHFRCVVAGYWAGQEQTGFSYGAWFKANGLRGLWKVCRRIREGRGKNFRLFWQRFCWLAGIKDLPFPLLFGESLGKVASTE